MKKFKKYPAYKDSGIEWIGEIPEHWEVTLLKSFMRNKSVKGYPDLKVLSVYRDYGVIPKDSRDDNHNVTSSDTSNYKVVEVGDFVINKMKAWQGSMGISNYKGLVSPAYITSSLDTSQVHGLYIHKILRSHLYIDEYNRLSYGVRIGQWDMHFQDFKNIQIPLPPLSEQKKIASFLDKKTGEIDKAIELKQKENELLKERRQVAINQAVTRGLHPDVTYKDSGIDWIGEIPEHWEVRKLKYLGFIYSGLSGKSSGDFDTENIGQTNKPYIPFTNIYNNDIIDVSKYDYVSIISSEKQNKVKNKDLLFLMSSETYEDIAKSAIYLGCDKELYLNSFCKGFRIVKRGQVNPLFVNYLLKASIYRIYFESTARGFTRINIRQSYINDTSIILPPLSEQKEIAEYLEELDGKTNRLLELNNRAIAKLKEYKQVIIDQAVRGQICLV